MPGGAGPAIVSPAATTPYLVRADAPVQFQKIPLSAQVGAESRRLFALLLFPHVESATSTEQKEEKDNVAEFLGLLTTCHELIR